MGVGDVPSVPSLALGSGEVTLQSLTAAYAAFANHGLVPHPILIRRVEDTDGKVLYTSEPSSVRAISDIDGVPDVDDAGRRDQRGDGASARSLGFTLPAGGKTGTTNDYNDAWFVGFTPNLRRRRLGRIRSAAARSCRAVSPPKSPCRSGRAS